MPLQTQVNLSVAPGVAGDKATPDQSVYTPLNPLAVVALPVGAATRARRASSGCLEPSGRRVPC